MKLSPILQTYKKRLLAAVTNDIPQHADPEVQSQLNHMIQRFRGALKFIRKTSITQHGQQMQLKELPWLLMVGPANSGKTALLAHAQVPYILQKNFTPSAPQHFEPSENVDWWATRYAGMIDVPSKYLFDNDHDDQTNLQHCWNFFLSLLKKQNVKKDICGIAITLPLPEIMRQNNQETFRNMLETLSQRINEIQSTLQKPLPCYLVITKCDLLAGFSEFFADTSDDELAQHWGIILPQPKESEQVEELFDAGFNDLIRKLNQQLLGRLHQERNPIARPYIKNFPLQIQRLKSFIAETIAQLNSGTPLLLRGVYLTSALQQKSEAVEPAANALVSNTPNGLQIFKEPGTKSRSYFIKQVLLRGMLPTGEYKVKAPPVNKRKQYALYAVSASIIILTAFLLGRDFKIGMEQTYKIQTNLNDYHHVLQQFHNPNDSMLKTLALLETLQKSKSAGKRKNFLKKVLTYYSDKSQKNAAIVYHNALQAFLMPEIRNYFADYLVNPINKDAESIYSVFKAYLMLNDSAHFNPLYIRMILTGILPKSFGHTEELLFHFDAALENYQPVLLDADTINNTRKYLLSLRGSQLGNIILKGMESNTQNSDALLGDNVKTNALFNTNDAKIPAMFTSKNFVNVFEQEIQVAAIEASSGNWVLGTDFRLNTKPNYTNEIAEEMRSDYVKKYADIWETAVANTKIEAPRDLEQADAIIVSMTSYDSPLLRILNNIHENTFFEPVTTASPKLFSIGQLIDRNNASKQELMQILTHLEALHEYLQPVLSAEDPKKAAYMLINNRMRHQGAIDPITKLRMASDRAPMPLKGWINQLTNDTWRFLLRDAMRYLDTSWNEKVAKRFETHMAHRYPFSDDSVNEVSYQKFIRFFGKPGIITSFYNDYLSTFIDTSKPQWEWKKLNGQDLPFSPDGLVKIQQAMNIHQAFFPNDDDKLFVPFALQQKMLAKNIKTITLNINSKIIVDKHNGNGSYYVLNWPYNLDAKYSSVALTTSGNKTTQLDFPGSWGWFKLVSQTFESARSDNQIILNFSKEKYPAKYLLSTIGKQNPFTSLNMNRFNLPEQLTINQA